MNHLLAVAVNERLNEAFEGPRGVGSMFTDPNTAILETLEQLSSEEASMSFHGTTVAAHADHTRFYLWGTNKVLKKGKQPDMDWGESWRITSVNETQWNRIQDGLKNEYFTLMKNIDSVDWNTQTINEALGSLAHSAYHLGAIRQMVKSVKDSQ
ncbi:hypothetical protein [Tenuibacillus multivorans]|uniref:DinB superfamily protein n=1 Tax=Tenuibacillus multivorans TaxID=237069 RepID=A0A1H0FGB0_9BACI|nr:hypothetical protein [Tenuibacillus multivorans]GEL77642.1 hypothetical protein TMU01_18770 [Tenuibacillus multivorans]SDN93459.1 hypothetical protein SAMN05216498_0232 [Tenuibacillus multivorans]